jgi:hypothetical protein
MDRPTTPYERGRYDAHNYDPTPIAPGKHRPVPDPGVSPGDQDEYDRGWNEVAARMQDPISAAYERRSFTDPERWAHYVELCKSAGVDPYPSPVDPARVMREPAYAHGSAMAAGLRLDFTRKVWTDQ